MVKGARIPGIILLAANCLGFTPVGICGAAARIEITGLSAEAMKTARIEVLEVSGEGEKSVFKGDAEALARWDHRQGPGTYHVYLEDKRTGLIYRLDDHGKGVKITKDKPTKIDASGFGARIREIHEKDAAENPGKEEALKRSKGRKSVFAVEEPGEQGTAAGTGDETSGETGSDEVHAPGELLVKFQPDTTLADRYRMMQELEAEARSKLDQLDVYRVKVIDGADLQALIQQFAGDPRLKYMEMNMVVSVPEPAEEGR